MSRTIRIRKGANIRLKGRPTATVIDAPNAAIYAVQPPDFTGVTPKLRVKEGDAVKAGSPLFFSKDNPNVLFTSPTSGRVKSIVRGEKRKILAIQIEANHNGDAESFPVLDSQKAERQDVLKCMLDSGLFAFVQQRPFAIAANPADMPRSIHISGFNSAPLAPDMSIVLEGRMADFQMGVNALAKLSGEKGVHIGVRAGNDQFANVTGAHLTHFEGPHPAGNVGVQIHHTDPLNKGEVLWTMHAEDVANLGVLLTQGKYEPLRIVGVGGSEHPNPQHMRALAGCAMRSFASESVTHENTRFISGDPLSGTNAGETGFLGSLDHQITLLPEGNQPKFLLSEGWLSPGLDKFSLSRSYPTWLLPKSKEFVMDTNSNGEERAFVVTGQYEAVFPFDIYPVQLIKSIMANDIDGMEKLGIYEVAPEDFALCEYACTSKISVQKLVRDGLDMLKKELA
jgi:Na+-transporting NADH:ubiquinone oxidoreductase subunit A